MTSPEPFDRDEEPAVGAVKQPSPLWERMAWVAFVASVLALILGLLQSPLAITVVAMALLWLLAAGVLGGTGWRKKWLRDALWFIPAVVLGTYVGWSVGSGLLEFWAVLQQLDDFDLYHYRLPWPSM